MSVKPWVREGDSKKRETKREDPETPASEDVENAAVNYEYGVIRYLDKMDTFDCTISRQCRRRSKHRLVCTSSVR